MKVHPSPYSKAIHLAGGVLLAGAALTATQAARAQDVYWSVGLSQPGVSLGFSNAPQVVYQQPVYSQAPQAYWQPAPVYYQSPPAYYRPAPAYYQPRPVYLAPRVVHVPRQFVVNRGMPVQAGYRWQHVPAPRTSDWHDGRFDPDGGHHRGGHGGDGYYRR